jgi:serine/threonine-protein kinase
METSAGPEDPAIRYQLAGRIGEGGMAEVHLAVRRGPGGAEQLVVLKLVHDRLATQQPFVDRLLEEGRLSRMIKHPNVVEVYDVGELDGRYFIAMEYLEGEPLLALLRAGGEGRGLDPMSTARVIANTAEGLEAAHRLKSSDGKPLGLVHHDVSLGNIVVLHTGRVKLVDFGVAKARSATARELIQGKVAYMAPEKLTEGAEIDRRSDLWSLGCVAWEALTLSRLFDGSDDADTAHQVMTAEILPPSAVNPDVPAELDPIVMRALERDPGRRYSTAKALAMDLEAVLRKRGYRTNNTAIAQYMQETFAERIAARGHLRTAIARGLPSPALLEMAFPDVATRMDRESVPALSNVPRSASVHLEEPAADEPVAARVEPVGESILADRVVRSGPPRRPVLAYAIGGALLLALVIVLATRRHAPANELATGAPLPAPAPAPDAAAAPEPVPQLGGPATVDPDPVVLDAGVAQAEIEMPAVHGKRARSSGATRGTPSTASGLYTAGLDAFRRGDAKAALRLLEQARQVDASYAPTWYGLGLVHESVGNRGAAKSEYLRYLSLAPRAANAAQVRDRLRGL